MPARTESRQCPGIEQSLKSSHLTPVTQSGALYLLCAVVVPEVKEWQVSWTGKFVFLGFIWICMFLYMKYFIMHITSPLDPLFLYSHIPKWLRGGVMWTLCLVCETLVLSTVLLSGVAAWFFSFVVLAGGLRAPRV